jgi:hypothetical protein
MKSYPVLFIGFALLAGCTQSTQIQFTQLPPDFRPDYGSQAYQTNRPMTGENDFILLGDTRFNAGVSAMRYTDKNDTNADFYFISVEYGDPARDNEQIVCYQRQFPVSSVPASVLTAKAKDVVSFDSPHRRVTFQLGPSNYTYTLPGTQ